MNKNEQYLKDRFLKAEKEAEERGVRYPDFSIDMLYAIRDMAKADVYPDGRFGDLTISVWEMFRY